MRPAAWSCHRASKACPLEAAGPLMLDKHSDGTYAVLPLTARCDGLLGSLKARYSLLFDVDPSHRGLVQWIAPGGERRRRPWCSAPIRPSRSWPCRRPAPGRRCASTSSKASGTSGSASTTSCSCCRCCCPRCWCGATARWQPVPQPARRRHRGAQGRHRLHPGALDHAEPGGAGRHHPALAPGRVGDRGLGGAGRAEQPARHHRAAGAGWWPSCSA